MVHDLTKGHHVLRRTCDPIRKDLTNGNHDLGGFGTLETWGAILQTEARNVIVRLSGGKAVKEQDVAIEVLRQWHVDLVRTCNSLFHC